LAATAVLCVLAGGTAGPAQGQDRPRELPAAIDAPTRATIITLGDSMAREGLPRVALYDKAAEGQLKGASDAKILAAVRSLAQRLRQTRSALGASATEAELVAGASALFAGVPPDVLRRVAAARAARTAAPSLAITLTVLTDLVSQQVPPDVAATSVELLVSRGARDLDLTELLRGVEQDVRGGRGARDALQERMAGTLRSIEGRRPN
jgi:hypothetical protein